MIKEMRGKVEGVKGVIENKVWGDKGGEMEREFKEGVGKREFERIEKVREEGYKGSED